MCVLAGGWEEGLCVYVCVLNMYVYVCVCWPAGGRKGCVCECVSVECVCVCVLAGGCSCRIGIDSSYVGTC